MGCKLIVSIIEKWEDFNFSAEEWDQLLACSEADTLFLTYDWIQAWKKVTGKFVRPFAVVVRSECEKLLGIAPFYFTTYLLLKLIPYRVLRIMADYPTGAEYPDWIVHKDREKDVVEVIANTLAECRNKWDCMWIPNLAGWTQAKNRFINACHFAKFYYHIRPNEFSCFFLPDDIESYQKGLSKGRRQNLRTEMNRILQGHKAKIVKCQSLSELPNFLDGLFELHGKRWIKKGELGTFRRKPLQIKFYKEFAPLAFSKNRLRLFALMVDGQFKAIQIGYVYKSTFHALQEGFDPGYVAGAGNVLRYKAIEACIAEGLKCYDFLGGVSEHKRRWLAIERTGYDMLIGRHSLKNHLLFSKEIWPTGRFLRPLNLPGSNSSALRTDGFLEC